MALGRWKSAPHDAELLQQMDGFIEEMLNNRRSLEKTLADLHAKIQSEPSPGLARTIELLRAEIELRERPARLSTASS